MHPKKPICLIRALRMKIMTAIILYPTILTFDDSEIDGF